MTAPWITTIRHEEARQTQQRTASANRRAAALKDGAAAVGSNVAVAELLGISSAAIGKAIAQAEQRAPGEPLADYLELDLPRTGSAVPTVAEWEALPEGDRAAVAKTAATTWATIAAVTSDLAAGCRRESEAIAEALLDADAPEGEPDVRLRLLADLADSLTAQSRTAWRQHDRWEHRAGDAPPSMVYAD